MLSTAGSAYGQSADQDEPLLGQLRRMVKSEPFSIGVVVQAVGDFAWDRGPVTGGNNGFSIATSRLSVRGNLDFGLGYFMQTDFTRTTPILDARLSYQITENLGLDAGLFKAPFSAEFLIPAPSIDFVNRSQVVSTLAPGRQVGVALRGSVNERLITYGAGVFNGNGRRVTGNDDNNLMYVGRLVVRPSVSSGTLEVGANVSFSKDDNATFQGNRFLVGGDARRQWDRWLASAEFIYADLDPDVGPGAQPFGYQATVGYMLDPGRHQILGRWDSLDLDGGATTRNFIVLGYNFWPTQAFEFQVNYLIPVFDGSDAGDQQILLNFQVAF